MERETSTTYIPEGYILEEKGSKRLSRLQCRECGGEMRPTEVCLDCNEPTVMYCKSCEKREDFEHVGHQTLQL